MLAARCKGVKLEAARLALSMLACNPEAQESARDFMARVGRIDVLLCPCCKSGTLQVVAVLAVAYAAKPSIPGAANAARAAVRGRGGGSGAALSGTWRGVRGGAACAVGLGAGRPQRPGRGAHPTRLVCPGGCLRHRNERPKTSRLGP